jgi:hypothetical protein
MKAKRTFPNGRTLAEQYAYEATLIGESSMAILREMEHLDPHLLGEYESKKNYLNADGCLTSNWLLKHNYLHRTRLTLSQN